MKKREKTNNGVKELLKKLKRHDAKVVAIAVIIALILSAGLIYISTPIVATSATEEFAENEKIANKETADKLKEIHDYLTELDKSVSGNKESLKELNEIASSSSTTDTINNNAEKIKSDTNKIIVETEKITTTINEKVTALDDKLGTVHTNIETTITKIEDLNAALDKGMNENREKINKGFEAVNKDLSEIKKENEQAMKQTKDLVAELQKMMKEDHEAMNTSMEEKYSDLCTRLENMTQDMNSYNTQMVESFQNDIASLQNNMNDLFKNTNDNINSNGEKTNKLITEKFEESNNSIYEKIAETNGNIDEKFEKTNSNINDKYEKTHDDINEKTKQLEEHLKEGFEAAETNAQERDNKLNKSINEGFTSTNNNIDTKSGEISTNMDNGFTNAEKNADTRANNTNKKIKDNFDLSEKNANERNAITNKNFNEKFTQTNNKFDTFNKNMDNQFNTINSTINNKFESMDSSVGADIGNLRGFIEKSMTGINTKFDQVFQRVSNGKKLLASTLLTKGVKIREDATFNEISDAISSIQTTITVENMPGEIVYDRHYHKDKNGKRCDEQYVGNTQKGGCFNKAIYHVHTSDCYKTVTYYRFRAGNHVEYLGNAHTVNGQQYKRYRCRDCGAEIVGTNPWHDEVTSNPDVCRERGGTSLQQLTRNDLVCGKNTDTLEGYGPDCGYLHGQIIAAHIDFSKNKNLATSNLLATIPGRGIGATGISEDLFNFDIDNYSFSEDNVFIPTENDLGLQFETVEIDKDENTVDSAISNNETDSSKEEKEQNVDEETVNLQESTSTSDAIDNAEKKNEFDINSVEEAQLQQDEASTEATELQNVEPATIENSSSQPSPNQQNVE